MKLGDIKAEALKLMFVNAGVDIAADNLIDYVGDDTYGYYLVNMPGAINRAFAALERKRVLPVRRCDLVAAAGEQTPVGVRFDMTALVSDYYDAERIVKESEAGYEGVSDYFREGDAVVIEGFDTAAMYRLLYRPTVRRVSMGTPDEYEVSDVPDHIACYLPYAVKAELYRDDDPDEAEAARAVFEMAMAEIAAEDRSGQQGSVRAVYGGGLMI